MRLHPLTVPYRGLRLGAMPAALLAAVGVLLAATPGAPVDGLAVVGLAAGVVGLAGLGWAALAYRRVEFALTAESLDLAAGVVTRRTRHIPRGRIQAVDVRQGLGGRLLGLAEARIETAGGAGPEATLRYVDLAVARTLQRRLGRRTAAADREPAAYAISPVELGLLSVTALDWRALAAVSLAGLGLVPASLGPGVDPSVLAAFGLAGGSALLALLGVVAGAATTTARYHRFRLWRDGGALRYERGLVRRYSGTVPLARVHRLLLRDGPVTRRLGYASLDVQTAGHGPGEAEDGGHAIPLTERARALELARSVEPFPAPPLARPPRRARRRYLVRYLGMAALAVVGSLAVDRWLLPVPWPWFVVPFLLAPAAAHLRWAHRGVRLGGQALVVRSGFWRRTTAVVPLYRIQRLDTTATLTQRWRSLATVHVDTARGSLDAHDLDAATARWLSDALARRLVVDRARRRRERWTRQVVAIEGEGADEGRATTDERTKNERRRTSVVGPADGDGAVHRPNGISRGRTRAPGSAR